MALHRDQHTEAAQGFICGGGFKVDVVRSETSMRIPLQGQSGPGDCTEKNLFEVNM
jgi:hypothetical protein